LGIEGSAGVSAGLVGSGNGAGFADDSGIGIGTVGLVASGIGIGAVGLVPSGIGMGAGEVDGSDGVVGEVAGAAG